MARRPRSAAWKLAAPASAAFALGSALALLAAYLVVVHQVRRELDAVLGSTVADLASESTAVSDAALDGWLAEERADLSRYLARSSSFVGVPRPPRVVLVAMSADGSPRRWVGIADPAPLLASLPRRSSDAETVERLRLPAVGGALRAVFWRPDGSAGFALAVSAPASPPLLRRIAATLAALWAAVVAIGASVAWWSVRRALLRVERLTRAAAAIEDAESPRRLDEAGDGDEIARLGATLNRMLDRINAAAREIRNLTRDAAHDLRTPLTAIRGRLEMALAQPAGPWREQVADAVEGLDRVTGVLQAVLDLAEAEGRALQLQREEVDLTGLCRDLVELYAPVAQKQGLGLTAETDGPLLLQADPLLLQRALGNLLDNALRHARGGSRVVAAVHRSAEGGAELVVEDDGDGFPEGLAARAFDRSARRDGSPGLGLGLPLVRAVARAHGGEATLGRGRLGGAEVRLRLPSA
jgi:signal transduction histidine kinase